MSSQQSLQFQFENRQPLARNSDPVTSHQSAAEITKSGKRNAQKAAVYDAVLHHPGWTSCELAKFAGLDRYVVARRLPDLRNDGLVHNGEIRTCRISGRQALTWSVA